jgi:cell division FtsZ-interacting protein ZapD
MRSNSEAAFRQAPATSICPRTITGSRRRQIKGSTIFKVSLPGDADYFAEISAGRHRFTVRFMNFVDPSSRPVQSDKDIDFDLLCCVI